MLTSDLTERYPKLTYALQELVHDQGAAFPEEVDFGDWDLQKLEESVSDLSDEELQVLAAGEEGDIKSLVMDKSLQFMNAFLAECFEGSLAGQLFFR